MIRRLHKFYLLIHPLICFTLFGLGGLFFGLIVFPIIHLTSPNTAIATDRVRTLISRLFRLFIRILKLTGRLQVHIQGEQIPKEIGPALILANHPMLIDVVFLIALIPNAACIVKGGIGKNPFLQPGARLAGYIYGDTEEEAIQAATRELKAGHPLIIFPEGTRSAGPSLLGKFKRGAATIALRTGCPILPVVIDVDQPFLTKGQKWRDFERLTQIQIEFLAPIDASQITISCRNDALSRRKLTAHLEDLFLTELGITPHSASSA